MNRKAARQPQASAIGVTMSGVTTAPSEPPLYATATPRARSVAGRVCVTVRSPPGKVAPSPKPSMIRATAKPAKPATKACEAEASDQTATARSMPSRTPKRSSHRPHSGLLIM